MSEQRQSLRRISALSRLDFGFIITRAPFWTWLALLALMTLFFCQSGEDFMHSGDSAAGGKRAVVTSALAVANDGAIVSMIFSTFFAAIIAGLTPIRDDEANVGAILHATPLRVSEYVWGKFLGVLLVCGVVVATWTAMMVVFYHLLPFSGSSEWRGAFHLANYVVPALLFLVPHLVFLAGVSFAVGSAFRQPILIFVLPFALLIGSIFISAASDGSSYFETQVMPLIEPSGFLWLRHTYLLNDRGLDFYNNTHIGLTAEFIVSRIGLVLVGLGAVALSQMHLARVLRNPTPLSARRRSRVQGGVPHVYEPVRLPDPRTALPSAAQRTPLAVLGMRGGRPGVWQAAWAVARIELDALRKQPGLYLFVPLIVLFCSTSAEDKTGMFSTQRIHTAGYLAASQWDTVSIFVAMLLLAYTVETLERERACGFLGLQNSLPVRTVSLLLGKFLALCVVAALPMFATATILLLTIAGQHAGAPLTSEPFFLLWGLLMGPSLLVWTAFVMALYVVTGHSRYQTYSWGALALLLVGTGDKSANWVGNIFLQGSLRWSDLAPLEIDRPALWLSRSMVFTLALFFAALAWRIFRRRDPDTAGTAGRRNVRGVSRNLLPLLPVLLIPVAIAFTLQHRIDAGAMGGDAQEKEKDYWRRNVATWQNQPLPGITRVALNLDLNPDARAYTAQGTFTLINYHAFPLTMIPITPALTARHLIWTLDGVPYTPENRAGLYVFTPKSGSLPPGGTLRIGFSYDVPDPGPTKNGVGNVGDASGMEFILPSAVVLTSFSQRLVPSLGYEEGIGVGEDNQSDAADPTVTNPLQESGRVLFGSATPFALHLTVTAPKSFTLNSVGTLVSQKVSGERRTEIWDSALNPNAPVRDFNVVGGRSLSVRHGGNGTAIYFYGGHRQNVGEMLHALDTARQWYGTWFAPYPWQDLKLTEFPDYAGYAQSFPTNISFGEGMGFLTRGRTGDDEDATDAFAVTAHESAHQWWGNLVVPGAGPGSNILSEGLAHYSAALLLEQVKGTEARQQFLREIEKEYNRSRSVDSELPLAKMSGGKKGDSSVTYDKGGWVFTMLSEQVMGRKNMLLGLRAYIAKYRSGSYHPDIADLLAVLRPYAPDKPAFDAFTNQWFYQVVLPEFEISGVKLTSPKAKTKKDKPLWGATFVLTNIGSGRVKVPFVIYGGNGERTAVTLPVDSDVKPGPLTIQSEFKPERIVVDPDVTILQRNRGNASAKF